MNFFIDRNIMHIRKVQDNMILLEKNREKLPFKIKEFELLRRGLKHDLSKFSKKLIKTYVESSNYYYNKEKGFSCENIDFNNIQKIKNIHYSKEKHHPHSKQNMSKIDICEMCCDLSAVAWENKEKDYTKYYINIQRVKFPILLKYDKEIIKILKLLEKLDK